MRPTCYLLICGLTILEIEGASLCLAAVRTETRKLSSGGPADFSNYGYSVAISGSTAIVGAFQEGSGAAYIYQRDHLGFWNQISRLTSPEPRSEFGFSVAIEGNLALVGARGAYSVGAVYAFARNSLGSWNSAGKLQAPNLELGDCFGGDVSLSGDIAVIGANLDEIRGPGSGAAYFFQRNGFDQWALKSKVSGSDVGFFDYFGESVSVDGDTAVIGAFGNEAAYVFQRDHVGQWSQSTKLRASDESFGRSFGLDVSIDGSRIAVGAPGISLGPGATYVFEEDGLGQWTQTARLDAPHALSVDFGGSVAIGGDLVLVGDVGQDEYTGAAYIFRKDANANWQPGPMLQASDAMYGDLFSRVAIDGRTAIVGAWQADMNGAAFLYENVPESSSLVLIVWNCIGFLGRNRHATKKVKWRQHQSV